MAVKTRRRASRKTDTESMRLARFEGGRKDFFGFNEGDTLIFVCPVCRPEDKRCVYPVAVHYGVGPDNKMVVCLDPAKNKILAHPFIQEFLAEKDIEGGCPVCEALASGAVTGEAAEDMKLKWKYLWNVVPIAFRRSGGAGWKKLEPYEVVPIFEGWTIYDGLLDIFGEFDDPSDYDAAIFARVNRVGSGKHGTKYKVSVDATTAQKPKRLGDEMVAMIEDALQHGGSGDMYQMAAKLCYDRPTAAGFLEGVAVAEEDEEAEVEESDGPALEDDEDESAAPEEREPGDDDDDVEEEEEEAEPAEEIPAQDAEVGEWYGFKGREGKFEGIEGGLAIFTTNDGKRVKAKPTMKVTPLVVGDDDEVLDDEDDGIPFDGEGEDGKENPAKAPEPEQPESVSRLRQELDKKKRKTGTAGAKRKSARRAKAG